MWYNKTAWSMVPNVAERPRKANRDPFLLYICLLRLPTIAANTASGLDPGWSQIEIGQGQMCHPDSSRSNRFLSEKNLASVSQLISDANSTKSCLGVNRHCTMLNNWAGENLAGGYKDMRDKKRFHCHCHRHLIGFQVNSRAHSIWFGPSL